MIKIQLYWHQATEDLELGEAYLDFVPSIGSLIAYSSAVDPRVVWRVETVYLHPAHAGSMTVLAVQSGRPAPDGQVGMVMLFVTPTDGPFHP